jgi:hypothetical protein
MFERAETPSSKKESRANKMRRLSSEILKPKGVVANMKKEIWRYIKNKSHRIGPATIENLEVGVTLNLSMIPHLSSFTIPKPENKPLENATITKIPGMNVVKIPILESAAFLRIGAYKVKYKSGETIPIKTKTGLLSVARTCLFVNS